MQRQLFSPHIVAKTPGLNVSDENYSPASGLASRLTIPWYRFVIAM